MSPEEIVNHIDAQNRSLLCTRDCTQPWTREEVLDLMNAAAMHGFRFGSESAISVVKSKLVVRYISEAAQGEA